ncbi:MAG: sulfatase/phosphatase domain-containing protein, partial [Planctomycetota bacterium]
GGQDYFKSAENPHGFFAPNLTPETGERFRGGKGSLYEGGLRVPFLVRWPQKIAGGLTSDHRLCFQDIMPTLAELTGAELPATDGISFVPSLLSQTGQRQHPFLYWEYGGQTAVREDDWKAVKTKSGDWQLYDLGADPEEKKNLAKTRTRILERLAAHAKQAHSPAQPGTVFDQAIVDKDRRQAPHNRPAKK